MCQTVLPQLGVSKWVRDLFQLPIYFVIAGCVGVGPVRGAARADARVADAVAAAQAAQDAAPAPRPAAPQPAQQGNDENQSNLYMLS